MPFAAVGGVGVSGLVDTTAALARENPVLSLLVALAALALVAGLWLAVRRLRRTAGESFRRALAKRDEVAVLMHPNPDPDAMACALGVKVFAAAVDTDATLHYPGQIRHQENRAFETVLDLDLDRIEDASDLAADTVVLVDHNTPRGFDRSSDVRPYAVVDHHPGEGTGTAFTDVRPDHGSCASIVAEYFQDTGWRPVGPEADPEGLELPSEVATGLIYGIQSDTKGLTKGCAAADFRASAYLYQGVDEDRLDRIANPEVDAEVLEVQARAIDERDVRNAFAFSDIGEVSNVDAIPQAADELLRLEGVTAVVVAGARNGTLHLSGRSRDDRVHMGKTLRAVVDDIPMAEAGGHARMGGGQLSLDHMAGLGPSDGLSREDLADQLFDAMSGER